MQTLSLAFLRFPAACDSVSVRSVALQVLAREKAAERALDQRGGEVLRGHWLGPRLSNYLLQYESTDRVWHTRFSALDLAT